MKGMEDESRKRGKEGGWRCRWRWVLRERVGDDVGGEKNDGAGRRQGRERTWLGGGGGCGSWRWEVVLRRASRSYCFSLAGR
ncbi:hypothetical protein AAC387_Pa07g0358 [Persea americana]